MPLRSSNRLRDIGLCGGAYRRQLVGPFWTPIPGPFSTPIDIAETQNAAAACAMVAAGLGFTIAEAVTVKGLNAQVAARSLRPTVTYSVTILGSPGHPLSTAALAFLKLVRSDLNS